MVSIFLLPQLYQGQKYIHEDLKQQLQGKSKLTDIMAVVDAYYSNGNNSGPGEVEKAYIHWKRWEWWMISHLDGAGDFVKNISQLNYAGLMEADRKWGIEISKFVEQNRSSLNKTAAEREAVQFQKTNEYAQRSFGDWTFIGPTADGSGPGDICLLYTSRCV